MTKHTQIQFRVSLPHKQRMQAAADAAGLSLSAWLLEKALGEVEKTSQQPREEAPQVIEKKRVIKNHNLL